jgi:hypothetical protein
MSLTKMGVLIATVALAGCTRSNVPTAPSTSTSAAVPTVARPAVSFPASDAVAIFPVLQPTITSVSPNVVSTTGSWGTITGTQIQPGAIVKIDGITVQAVFRDSTIIQFPSAGTHAPGSVDVTVTNPGGLGATLVHALTYAPAESFDVDGEWIAHTDARHDYEIDMRFTIRNHVLVSVSCGIPVTMPITVAAEKGSFSFAGADGMTMSGVLASTTTASRNEN